jgi:uncharacterized protein (DUF488 family)
MNKMQLSTIWTIGHSTRTREEFVEMLQHYGITLLVDIRSFPGSRRYPHFNKEALEVSIPNNNIKYIHLLKLGGRKKVKPDSGNTAWKHPAFRGYADYMETEEFKEGIAELEGLAGNERTVIMCSEAVWWSCHRSMVSDYLKVREWEVLHIMALDKVQEHPFTAPARVIDGKLTYKGLL